MTPPFVRRAQADSLNLLSIMAPPQSAVREYESMDLGREPINAGLPKRGSLARAEIQTGSLVTGAPNFTQSFGPKLKCNGLGNRMQSTVITSGSQSGALPAVLASSAFRLVIVPMFCPCHVT